MRMMDGARVVLRQAIEARVFPGAVVEAGDREGTLAAIVEGRLTYDIDAAPAALDTVYDLASLTKVLSATTNAMGLVDEGRLGLDDRVGRWIGGWSGGDRDGVTVRHLLDHSSGLPAHRRYFDRLQGRREFERAICAEPLEYAPGSQSLYSDLGFMLLGFVLEEAGGGSLDDQFDRWRTRELGTGAVLQYRPPDQWLSRVAPTEIDPWRGRLLSGEVHDENAASLGGVAAHAGLFGDAASVGAVARWWLRRVGAGNDGRPGDRAELPGLFVTPTGVPGSSRALGWDTMRPTSSCGSRLSPAAFGHTGFTGTSLWIDPAWRPAGLYVVFLTNRVHPSREGDGMTRVRQALHNAVADDL